MPLLFQQVDLNLQYYSKISNHPFQEYPPFHFTPYVTMSKDYGGPPLTQNQSPILRLVELWIIYTNDVHVAG